MAFHIPPKQAQGAYRYDPTRLRHQGPARLFPHSGEDGWWRHGLNQMPRTWVEQGRFSEPVSLILRRFNGITDQFNQLWDQAGTLLADQQIFQSGWLNFSLPPGEPFNSNYVGDRRDMAQILLAANRAANRAGDRADEQRSQFYQTLEARGRQRPVISRLDQHQALSDREFARQRLAGTNPMILRRVQETDQAQLQVWATQPYGLATGETIDLLEAVRQHRLFIADYPLLQQLTTADLQPGRYVGSPQAVFYRSEQGLYPVLIQLEPGGKVFTPKSDRDEWMRAKLYTQIADITHHELIDHLGHTHLAMEAFAIATARQLPAHHPFYRLLQPHFQFLLAINTRGNQLLLADDAAIETLLAPTREASVALIDRAYRQRPFSDYALPQDIARRGIEPEYLPEFPYRDDAQLVWDAIARYTHTYLHRYYQDDQSVQQDPYLQAWAAELGQPPRSPDEFPVLPAWLPADVVAQMGLKLEKLPNYPRVPEFPASGPSSGTLTDLPQLMHVATQIIFTCTAQHAAVNFSQFDYAGYAPNMPLAAYARPDEATRLDHLLPPPALDLKQMELTFALSGITWGRLGDSQLMHFEGGDRQVLAQFQLELQHIEQQINQRNHQRRDREGFDYPYLLPSNIPNSINI